MRRNTVRIVCNPYTNQISYHFKSEKGEWDVLSGNSPLSRQHYTNTTIQARGDEIVSKLDEIYNRKNKGLDVLFEGTSKDYVCLCAFVNNVKNRDITCKLGTTKIAVLGKKSVGKTCLIEGLEDLSGYKYQTEAKQGYTVYSDECNHAKWYEIDGIDLGLDKVETAYASIKTLANEGLTAVIYCISACTGRIENAEKELIKKISEGFAQITVMVVLTMATKEDMSVYDEIEKITNQVKIVPTLAKPYKIAAKDREGNGIVIEPYGLEKLSQYIFEGR